MDKVTYNGMTFVPYIKESTIQGRITEIAAQITIDYSGLRPLFLCVRTGAVPFAGDVLRSGGIDAEISFIRLKSYEGTSTTGKVKEVMGLTENLEGRDVIVIEDIVDTGTTIKKLVEDLKAKGTASVKVASLLFKPESLLHDVKPDYTGFSIPSKFIIGFGLDLDGLARNLRDIYVLEEK